MTAKELIYLCKNTKSGGTATDDDSISDYQWLFTLNYYRSQLIKQQISKGQSINEQCIQVLKSSKIILTQNPIERCEMYSNPIPKVIESVRSNLFTYVGTEGGKSYQRTTYNKSRWDNQSKYVGHLPKWYEIGNKLTVVNHNKSLKLSIHALFENPMEVVEFNGELNEMNPFEFEYPVSSTMVDTVLKMIIDSELKINLLVPKDNLNDGRDGESTKG